MTLPDTPHIPPTGPGTGGNGPQTWPATAIAVDDPLCGHLPGERHDGACDYWRGVALGEYPSPDGQPGPYGLPGHLPGLLPLTDPALRGATC